MFGILRPAAADVPEPVFGPEDAQAISEDAGVEHHPPASLTELLHRRGHLRLLPLSEPALDL